MDLYMFQKHQPLHQDVVNAKLATHGVNFRIYIRRALTKISEERGEPLPDETSMRSMVEGEFTEIGK